MRRRSMLDNMLIENRAKRLMLALRESAVRLWRYLSPIKLIFQTTKSDSCGDLHVTPTYAHISPKAQVRTPQYLQWSCSMEEGPVSYSSVAG